MAAVTVARPDTGLVGASTARATIYVITYHRFNHHLGRQPLDERFLAGAGNYVYFLIDEQRPRQLAGRPVLFEKEIDPELHVAGRRYLAEWTFLLAEVKHAFCDYPFFMTSSRFYEKNAALESDLNREWEALFAGLAEFGWGYLPSYDRPFGWEDLRVYQKDGLLPVSKAGRELVVRLYGVDIPGDYRWMSDFFCNYIGFSSREHLLAYVDFYRPVFAEFFDEHFIPKSQLAQFVGTTGAYRNEKPFTFFVELISHLFFYKNNLKFMGLHYDGYYGIDERRASAQKLGPLSRQPVPDRMLGFPPGYTVLEHRLRRLFSRRLSPYRLLFDGFLTQRIRNVLGRSRK